MKYIFSFVCDVFRSVLSSSGCSNIYSFNSLCSSFFCLWLSLLGLYHIQKKTTGQSTSVLSSSEGSQAKRRFLRACSSSMSAASESGTHGHCNQKFRVASTAVFISVSLSILTEHFWRKKKKKKNRTVFVVRHC